MRRHALVFAWVIASLPLAAPAADVAQPWHYDLEQHLMSPYCPGRTLTDCTSPQAADLREWIASQEQAGRSRTDVEAQLYREFGEVILQAPRAEGFGLAAYVIPVVCVLLGASLVFVFLRRQSARAAATATRPSPSTSLDPELDRQIDEEMRRSGTPVTRLKIYTRRGDTGETDLVGSGRVAKDDRRVEAYGAVDELNAAIGVGAAATAHADLRSLLEDIQRSLFALGAYLATPEARHRESMGMREPNDAEIETLERRIDALETELAPLQRFVLPGGTPSAAAFHVARTVCRRAERVCVALDRDVSLAPGALRYLNRLSDLLFVLARVENRRAGVSDVEWEGRRKG